MSGEKVVEIFLPPHRPPLNMHPYTHKSVKKEGELFKLYDFNFISREQATPSSLVKIISLLSGRMSLKIIIESFSFTPLTLDMETLSVQGREEKSLREVTFRLIAIKLNLSRRLGTLNLGYTRESQLDFLLPKKKKFLPKKHVTGVAK